MNWGEERYTRLYTRDTAEWLALCWQARSLHPNLLRKADRCGIVAIPEGPRRLRLLSGLVHLPLEIVTLGLKGTVDGSGLLEDGCVVERPCGFVWPNYIDANEAPASLAQRSREFRARNRDLVLAQALGVVATKRGDAQRNVADSNETSKNATPCRAVPSFKDLEASSSTSGVSSAKRRKPPRGARREDSKRAGRQAGAAAPPRSSGPSPAADDWLRGADERRRALGRPGADPTPSAEKLAVLERALAEHGTELLAMAHEWWLADSRIRAHRDGSRTRVFLTEDNIAEQLAQMPKTGPAKQPTTPAEKLWAAVIEQVIAAGKTYAASWLSRLNPIALERGELIVGTHDTHFRDWAEANYAELIATTLSHIQGAPARVQIRNGAAA